MLSDTIPDRLEIRPKRVQNAVQIVGTNLVFVALAVSLIFTGQFIPFVIGIIFVPYFAWMALSAILKAFQRNNTMTFTGKGIELYDDFGTVIIRWKNIRSFGPCPGTMNMIGIRLKNYAEFLADIDPGQEDKFMHKLNLKKVPMFINYLITFCMPIPVIKDQRESCNAYQDIFNVKDFLRWNRDTYGYDVTLAWTELDRSIDEFLKLLEKYVSRFGGGLLSQNESVDN
jgi:hypothetical protein